MCQGNCAFPYSFSSGVKQTLLFLALSGPPRGFRKRKYAVVQAKMPIGDIMYVNAAHLVWKPATG